MTKERFLALHYGDRLLRMGEEWVFLGISPEYWEVIEYLIYPVGNIEGIEEFCEWDVLRCFEIKKLR